MELKQIAKMPTVIDNKHESIYQSYQILEKVIEMLQRNDSNETILETIKLLKDYDTENKVVISGCFNTASVDKLRN